jgi:hypothetical protein
MTHAKPLGYWRCRACIIVWKGKQLHQDPQSTVLKWMCGDLFCGGTVDNIDPDEIVKILNIALAQTDLTDSYCYNGNHESRNGICVVDGGIKPEARG